MKSAAIVIIILVTSIFMPESVGADANYATVKVEKFDPPAAIDQYNDLIEVVTVTNLPGAPGLVMHIPCLRSSLSTKNRMLAMGRLVAPGVVEGCTAQKIPRGSAAGELVKEDGLIFAPPPH